MHGRSQTTSKNYVRFQPSCTNNAKSGTKNDTKIIEMMLERLPLTLEACINLTEKASQNSSKTSPQVCQKGAMAAKGDQNGGQKESEFIKNCYFWGSCAQGLLLTSFLSSSEAIYARNDLKMVLQI